MSNKEKLVELTNSLIARTKDGTITWSETAEENTYRAVLATGMVRVGRHENPYLHVGEGVVPITTVLPFAVPIGFESYGEFIYSLFVLENKGRELFRFIAANQEEANCLQSLWNLAFGVASNPEEKLDNILRELSSTTKKK